MLLISLVSKPSRRLDRRRSLLMTRKTALKEDDPGCASDACGQRLLCHLFSVNIYAWQLEKSRRLSDSSTNSFRDPMPRPAAVYSIARNRRSVL